MFPLQISASRGTCTGADLWLAWPRLQAEIVAAYADAGRHAAFLWGNARGVANAPSNWQGENPDAKLAAAIWQRVEAKARKPYAASVVLLIEIPPGVTLAEDLSGLLLARTDSPEMPFLGVYVTGTFPTSTSSAGGYQVLPLKAFRPQHRICSPLSLLARLFAWLQRWYRGTPRAPFIDSSGASSMFALLPPHFHWTARLARLLVDFYARHWQWIIGTTIALAALLGHFYIKR
jgi:hypothetical protein